MHGSCYIEETFTYHWYCHFPDNHNGCCTTDDQGREPGEDCLKPGIHITTRQFFSDSSPDTFAGVVMHVMTRLALATC